MKKCGSTEHKHFQRLNHKKLHLCSSSNSLPIKAFAKYRRADRASIADSLPAPAAAVHGRTAWNCGSPGVVAPFDLVAAVCSHGLFVMAPNRWDLASRALVPPLRLASDRSPSPSLPAFRPTRALRLRTPRRHAWRRRALPARPGPHPCKHANGPDPNREC